MVGRLERNKDLVQDVVENTAKGVGAIASIITSAVADVTREIGDIVTDAFEMREAAKLAGRDDPQRALEAAPGTDPADEADPADDPDDEG